MVNKSAFDARGLPRGLPVDMLDRDVILEDPLSFAMLCINMVSAAGGSSTWDSVDKLAVSSNAFSMSSDG